MEVMWKEELTCILRTGSTLAMMMMIMAAAVAAFINKAVGLVSMGAGYALQAAQRNHLRNRPAQAQAQAQA